MTHLITIPDALHQELQKAAVERGITVAELMQKFIKLGLLAVMVEETDDSALMLKTKDDLQELLLV